MFEYGGFRTTVTGWYGKHWTHLLRHVPLRAPLWFEFTAWFRGLADGANTIKMLFPIEFSFFQLIFFTEGPKFVDESGLILTLCERGKWSYISPPRPLFLILQLENQFRSSNPPLGG